MENTSNPWLHKFEKSCISLRDSSFLKHGQNTLFSIIYDCSNCYHGKHFLPPCEKPPGILRGMGVREPVGRRWVNGMNKSQDMNYSLRFTSGQQPCDHRLVNWYLEKWWLIQHTIIKLEKKSGDSAPLSIILEERWIVNWEKKVSEYQGCTWGSVPPIGIDILLGTICSSIKIMKEIKRGWGGGGGEKSLKKCCSNSWVHTVLLNLKIRSKT